MCEFPKFGQTHPAVLENEDTGPLLAMSMLASWTKVKVPYQLKRDARASTIDAHSNKRIRGKADFSSTSDQCGDETLLAAKIGSDYQQNDRLDSVVWG